MCKADRILKCVMCKTDRILKCVMCKTDRILKRVMCKTLPGQAPSLMTRLSRAESHDEENPRLASNTILKIILQQ